MLEKAESFRRQDQGPQGTVRQARTHQCADHRRRRHRAGISPGPRATFPTSMCCPCRASTSTTSCGASAWCSPRRPLRPWRRASNEEEEMLTTSSALRSSRRSRRSCPEHNQVIVQGGARRFQSRRSRRRSRSCFNVKVKAVNTQVRKGKMKIFKNIRARLSDAKRAIMTLEEGHSIDVTTGPVRIRRWHLKTYPSDHARPAPAGAGRPQQLVEGRAGQDADRRQDQVRRPQQSTAASPRATSAAATSRPIGSVDFRA